MRCSLNVVEARPKTAHPSRGEDPGHLPRNAPTLSAMPRHSDRVQMSNTTHLNGYGNSINAVSTLITHYFTARYSEFV
jgi:hypothetical protein